MVGNYIGMASYFYPCVNQHHESSFWSYWTSITLIYDCFLFLKKKGFFPILGIITGFIAGFLLLALGLGLGGA